MTLANLIGFVMIGILENPLIILKKNCKFVVHYDRYDDLIILRYAEDILEAV